MSKRKIQPTLFAFGLTKKVKKREEVVKVSLSEKKNQYPVIIYVHIVQRDLKTLKD